MAQTARANMLCRNTNQAFVSVEIVGNADLCATHIVYVRYNVDSDSKDSAEQRTEREM